MLCLLYNNYFKIMKKILTLSILTCSALILNGCTSQQTNELSNEPSSVSQQQASISQPEEQVMPPIEPDTKQAISQTDLVDQEENQAISQTDLVDQKENQEYITIEEFGIKVPVTPEMKNDLSYKYKSAKDRDGTYYYVKFFSKKLNAINKECARGGIANVLKFPGQFVEKAGEPNIGINKQFPNFFISFSLSSYYCVVGAGSLTAAEKATIMTQEDLVKKDLSDALQNSILITE